MGCLFRAIWYTSMGCERWVWTSGWIMISWDTPKKPRGKPVLVPLHLPSISLKISWDWIWGSAVRSQHFLRPAPQLPCSNNMWSLWANFRPQEQFQHWHLWGRCKTCRTGTRTREQRRKGRKHNIESHEIQN